MKEVSMMKKNHLLKLSLTILTVCFAFLLVACGQKEEVTYYQRIDQSNQFDMRLTYYQTVKGIKEKVSFDKNGIKENIEIDYDKADLKELASLPGMMISNEKNAKKISMKASGEALEKSGFKKVENGKFEELKK